MVNASKIKQNVSKKKPKSQSSGNSSRVAAHLHCRVCYEVIPSGTDPRVCSVQECIDRNIKDEKNQKQMRIWMFVFLGLFAFAFVGPIVLGSV